MSLEDLEDDSPPPEEPGAPAWMATFSDMATLLLTFFILLLSFANLDIENFRVALGSVKEAFGVQLKVNGDFEALSTSPVELSDKESQPEIQPAMSGASRQLEQVKRFIQMKGLHQKIEVVASPRGIVLRIKDVVLFDTGSDELRPGAEPILAAISELFASFDGQMVIEGHTDNVPINSFRFPSNWELSTARSTAVLRRLMRDRPEHAAGRLHVAGYADSRPLGANDTAEGRSRNRRVEFLFETQTPLTDVRPKIFRLPFSTVTP